MFKFFHEIPSDELQNSTLILPAVSVGNVGQLTTDLLITNLKSCKKVGRVFHPALEPVVGNDISEDGQVSLMTSCEIYHHPENKLIILQFHAPVLSKRTDDFVAFLADWISASKIGKVICLSSTFASERIDSQLVGPPFRYLTSSAVPSDLQDVFSSLHWKRLEGRQFPAPPVYSENDRDQESSGAGTEAVYIPGSGITRSLIYRCEANQIPIATILMFVSEGDNTPDAKLYLSALNQLFNWLKGSNTKVKGGSGKSGDSLNLADLIIPASWVYLFGPSFPPEIY